MLDDDYTPDDEGMGFLESYELPEPLPGRWGDAPLLDGEWDL